MSRRWNVDRFEGRDKEIAVLVDDEGVTVNIPRALLPDEVGAGEVVTITIARDAEATAAVAAEAEQLAAELKATDPGGDIAL